MNSNGYPIIFTSSSTQEQDMWIQVQDYDFQMDLNHGSNGDLYGDLLKSQRSWYVLSFPVYIKKQK